MYITSSNINLFKICITPKYQKNSSNINFFINPQCEIKGSNARIIECNDKYIVLLFEKSSNIFLFSLLKKLSLKIYSGILDDQILINKDKLFDDSTTNNIYPIYHENANKDKFTIRCYYSKRNIKFYDEDSSIQFFKPSFNTSVKYCEMLCKNVWKTTNLDKTPKCVYGFNMILTKLVIE